MATQSNWYGDHHSDAGWETADRRGEAAQQELPPLPNQGIYFYRKRIDNSRVERQADPRERAHNWRWIAGASACTLFLVALLWPGVYGVLAGYQIGSLEVQQQKLLAERASLELAEAYQLDPGKLDEVAAAEELGAPASDQVVHLPPAPDGSLAMNTKSK